MPPINDDLRKKILAAAAVSSLAIAGVLVGASEGRVYVPYQDTGGVWTVCEGHTGKDVIRNHRYTDAECDAFKASDLAIADAAVSRYVTVPLSAWQRAALDDFTFNLGAGALRSSTLLKKLNAGDYEGACLQYQSWNKGRVRGVLTVLGGLVTRRNTEEWVCRQS